jgi:hypothetical protein
VNDDQRDQYAELVRLAQDLIHPEQYGHAIPQEVRARASRVLKMHPKKPVPYDGPPQIPMD